MTEHDAVPRTEATNVRILLACELAYQKALRGDAMQADLDRFAELAWNAYPLLVGQFQREQERAEAAEANARRATEALRRMREALGRIANHPACSYEKAGPGQYGMGIADGHRLAARIANDALARDPAAVLAEAGDTETSPAQEGSAVIEAPKAKVDDAVAGANPATRGEKVEAVLRAAREWVAEPSLNGPMDRNLCAAVRSLDETSGGTT